MKKKIAALAAAVMIVSALPVLAAESADANNTSPNAPYCWSNQDGSGCGGPCGNQQGQGGHHRGGCWRQ